MCLALGTLKLSIRQLIGKVIQALIRPLIGVSPVPAHTLCRFAALLVVACHLGGCRGDEPLGPEAEVAGVYVLTDIAGTVLPTRLGLSTPASGRHELLADTLTLSADGTIRRVMILRQYPGYNTCTARFCPPTDSRDDGTRGTWVSRDSVVTLRYGDAVELTRSGGVEADGALVVTEPPGFNSGAWRYRRQ